MIVKKLILLSRCREKLCERYVGKSYTKKIGDFPKLFGWCNKTMTLIQEI